MQKFIFLRFQNLVSIVVLFTAIGFLGGTSLRAQGIFDPAKNRMVEPLTHVQWVGTIKGSMGNRMTRQVGLDLDESTPLGDILARKTLETPVSWITEYQEPRIVRTERGLLVSWMVKANSNWKLRLYGVASDGQVRPVVVIPVTSTGVLPTQWQVVVTRSSVFYIAQWRQNSIDNLGIQRLTDGSNWNLSPEAMNITAEVAVPPTGEVSLFSSMVRGEALGVQWVVSHPDDFEVRLIQGGMELPVPIVTRLAKPPQPASMDGADVVEEANVRLVSAGVDEIYGIWEDQDSVYWVPLHEVGPTQSGQKSSGYSVNMMDALMHRVSD